MQLYCYVDNIYTLSFFFHFSPLIVCFITTYFIQHPKTNGEIKLSSIQTDNNFPYKIKFYLYLPTDTDDK